MKSVATFSISTELLAEFKSKEQNCSRKVEELMREWLKTTRKNVHQMSNEELTEALKQKEVEISILKSKVKKKPLNKVEKVAPPIRKDWSAL